MGIKNIRTIRNLTALLSANGLLYLLTAVFVILFGRERGPEELGIYSFFFILATIIRTIHEAGYEYSLPRDMNQSGIINIAEIQQIKNLLWLIILIPAAIILYLVTDYPAVLLLLIYNYIFSQSITLKTFFKGKKNMKPIPFIEGLWTFFLMLTNILCLYYFYNLILIFIFYSIFELFKWLHYYYAAKNTYGINSVGSLSGFLKFSSLIKVKIAIRKQIRIIILYFSSSMQFRSPLLALGLFSTQSALGIYSGAFRFLSIFKILPGAILDALLPEFSSDRSYAKLAKSISYGTLISFVVFLPVYIFADEIIILLLTDKFAESVPILKIMSFMFIPMTINLTLESYLISISRENIINFTLLISAIFILLFSYFSILNFNLEFVAFVALAGEIIITGIYLIIITKIKMSEENDG